MRILLTVVGVVALLIGLLWMGQGLGIVRWPAESFMIGVGRWTVYGAILAAVGLLLILFGRKR